MSDDPLDELIQSVPSWRRPGMRTILALARRPRGLRLLGLLAPADQAGAALAALRRYDEPALARRLGWDAEAVVSRGRKLRRAEGRP